MSDFHQSVLLEESIHGLDIKPDGIYVDATYGGGGHAKEILKQLKTGRLIAFDQDEEAIKNKIDDKRLVLLHNNFRYLKRFLKYYQIKSVNGIIADLGVSSHQFDQQERGFSTRFDAVPDMRMDQRKQIKAVDILNTYELKELTDLFRQYGEIENSYKLAQVIVEQRKKSNINTISEFRKTIESCVPKGKENKYLAKVFQALRIEINEELDALKEFLIQAGEVLVNEGTLVIISYHSLEDRLVKNYIKTGNFEGRIEKDFFGNVIAPLQQIHRKVIIPAEDEIATNNRARSAKLRIARKVI